MEKLAKQSANREPVHPEEWLLSGKSPWGLWPASIPASGWSPRGAFSWPLERPSEYGGGIWLIEFSRGLLWK
jgi:hypothetical protein